MILEYLQRHVVEQPDQLFLADDVARLSFRSTILQVRQLAAGFRKAGMPPGSPVYLYARDSALLITALLASQQIGNQVCVLNRSFEAEELRYFASRLKPGPLLTDATSKIDWPGPIASLAELNGATDAHRFPSAGDTGAGGIIILTTGTTGLPKAVFYDWTRLLAQVRSAESPIGRTWALLYPLNHFAGLQVFLHAVKNGLPLIIPRSRQFPDVIECLLRNKVDSISATPTFWRMFTGQLTSNQASQLDLTQITLGGEPVAADILSRLRNLFPKARITQVFATTEIGSCFAVNDGLPGFPAEFLDRLIGNVQLTIRDGQLYVRAANAMVGYADGSTAPESEGEWIATGDFVEVRNERVYFLGRKSEVVNVGGVKVYPPAVEEQIRRVDGVRDVRVYGKPNPVTGQIVAADLEIMEGMDEETVLDSVRRACRSSLNRYEQPRELHVVNKLTRSNEKVMRRQA